MDHPNIYILYLWKIWIEKFLLQYKYEKDLQTLVSWSHGRVKFL